MNSKEKWLLDRLKNYHLMQGDIERLQAKLQSASYKLTATYGLTAGGSGGFGGSKVETLGIRRVEIKRELEKKQATIQQIHDALNHSGLSKRERDLVVCTIRGYSLSDYARQKNIYKSHVYKIRDNALKKMVVYLEKTARNER